MAGQTLTPPPPYPFTLKPIQVLRLDRLSDRELRTLAAAGFDVVEELIRRGLVAVH